MKQVLGLIHALPQEFDLSIRRMTDPQREQYLSQRIQSRRKRREGQNNIVCVNLNFCMSSRSNGTEWNTCIIKHGVVGSIGHVSNYDYQLWRSNRWSVQ